MGGLFGGSPAPPPKPKPPAPMPDDQSPMVREAKRNEALSIVNREGSRRSTILSNPFGRGPSANYDTYDRSKLGGQ